MHREVWIIGGIQALALFMLLTGFLIQWIDRSNYSLNLSFIAVLILTSALLVQCAAVIYGTNYAIREINSFSGRRSLKTMSIAFSPWLISVIYVVLLIQL